MKTAPLDWLVESGQIDLGTEAPPIFKMDIEGFEHHAMMGATRMLARTPPRFMVSEFTPSMIEGSGSSPLGYLDLMHGLNFSISTDKGLPVTDLAAFAAHPTSNDVFFVPAGVDALEMLRQPGPGPVEPPAGAGKWVNPEGANQMYRFGARGFHP